MAAVALADIRGLRKVTVGPGCGKLDDEPGGGVGVGDAAATPGRPVMGDAAGSGLVQPWRRDLPWCARSWATNGGAPWRMARWCYWRTAKRGAAVRGVAAW